jgi:flavin reductase (DIM6/NTAB) family NADH-FMN oxidoreductase RutF
MKSRLDPVPMLYPMPAVLVATYRSDGTANAMTVGWTAACNAEPPCIGVAIRNGRQTHANIVARKAFTINIPRADQAVPVDFLGIVSGTTDPDKIEKSGFTTQPAELVDAPIIVECPINVELKLLHALDLGCHTWFVGEVVRIHADDDVLESDRRINVTALNPLVYMSNVKRYAAVGELRETAFSCGRALKK